MNQAFKEALTSGNRIITRATGLVSGAFGGFASLLIMLFVGLYGAVEPDTYKRGLVRLFPLPHPNRIQDVLNETAETLKWWLVGKFMSMTIIGLLTIAGLWLLGVPLALVLGLIAAILTFIPNIGPILSAAPAVLIGLAEGPRNALWITLLYIGIQTIESYLITPLIQRRTVSIPPALTLSAQILMGLIFGALGVAVATPLTAVAIVLTKRLYIEDTLSDELCE